MLSNLSYVPVMSQRVATCLNLCQLSDWSSFWAPFNPVFVFCLFFKAQVCPQSPKNAEHVLLFWWCCCSLDGFRARDVSPVVFALISDAKCMLCASAFASICVWVCFSACVCVWARVCVPGGSSGWLKTQHHITALLCLFWLSCACLCPV